MVTAILLLSAAAIAADCPQPTSVAQLHEALTDAETAYAARDLPGFESAVERARGVLPCLEEVVPPSTAAALHRTEGLSAFVGSNADRASRAFGAARRLQPAYRFPKDLVAEGNPVHDSYAAFELAALPTIEAPAPTTGTLRIDGQPSRERPTTIPALVQWVEVSGTTGSSGYLWPGDPLPAYPIAPTTSETKGNRKVKLALGAAGGALLTGGLYAANAGVHGRYLSPNAPRERLDSLRSVNNALVVASGVSLALTVGTGAAAIAVKP